MTDKKPRLLPRFAGYSAFSLFALVTAFFLTFPWEALKDRVRLEADAAGYFVRLGSLGPGLLSVRASDVQVSRKSDAEPPPEPLKLDSVSLGPALFPPGLKLTVKGLDGTVTAAVGTLGSTRVSMDVDGLDLSKGNLKGFSGIDFVGTVDAHLDLAIPKGAAQGNAPAEPDLSLASGTFSLDTRGVTINGGSITMVIPQFGADPTPLDLPKVVVGDLGAKVKIEKGLATVEEWKSRSPDVELAVGGTVKLGKRLEYSEAGLEVRFKPDPGFQGRLGLIGSAFSMVGPDPKDPAWRLGRLTGFLGRPQFR